MNPYQSLARRMAGKPKAHAPWSGNKPVPEGMARFVNTGVVGPKRPRTPLPFGRMR